MSILKGAILMCSDILTSLCGLSVVECVVTTVGRYMTF